MNGRWIVHTEHPLYTCEWVSLHLAEVEKPSGIRQSHHLVRLPAAGAGAVVVNDDGEVLLIWRHRFIPDRWGWELPAGRVDPGEDPAQAAAREVAEETGWQVRGLRHLCSMHTTPGLADQVSHVFLARADRHTGPCDHDETVQVRWCPPDELTRLARTEQITDAFTLTGLLWYLQFEHTTG